MKTKKTKIILITVCLTAFLLCILTSVYAVRKLNKYHLELNISDETITLEYGVDEMPEVTALCKGTLLHRNGIPVKVR